MAFGIREPEFAGTLYPADGQELLRLLERLMVDSLREDGKRVQAQGVFLPHGPYIFAAECAAVTMAQVEVPDLVVVLHPRTVTARHGATGGPALVAAPYGLWRTPLGDMPADLTVARALGADLTTDWEEGEHAAEVVLPYLQMLNMEARACIIGVGELTIQDMRGLAKKLCVAMEEVGEDRVLLVAASDYHFGESRDVVVRRTDDVLDPMERMDAEGLAKAVAGGALMSGSAAVGLMMMACRLLGCSELVVASQSDSSETGGDYDDVAAYASGWVV